MNFTITEVFGILIIYQSITFSGYLLFGKKIRSGFNLWLAIFLLVIGFNFMNVVGISSGIIPVEFNYGLLYGFLYGPLLLIYTEKIIQKSDLSGFSVDFRHFAPALIIVVVLSLSNYYSIIIESLELVTILVVTHIVSYIVVSLFKIRRFQSMLKSNFASIENKNLSWLKSLLIMFVTIVFITLIEALLPGRIRYESTLPQLVIYIFTLFAINMIYFRGIRYPELFNEYVVRSVGKKYAHSSMSANDLDLKLEQMESFMGKEKPYLDFELSLKSLSKMVSMNPRDLSQVINEKLKVNFYEYVNNYRLKEALKLIETDEGKDKRINEIMYASGFSSKSTFNNIFKKNTGLTPKQYRDKKEI